MAVVCADCGRARSVSGDGPARARARARARALRTAGGAAPRRERLPPLRDAEATVAFLRDVKRGVANGTAHDVSLPRPHAHLLRLV